MQPHHDDDDHGRALAYLHGVWRDEIRGSTYYVVVRGDAAHTVYCYAGDHALTGEIAWQRRRGQFFGAFRWAERPIEGVFVLQPDSDHSMLGGWWYAQDLAGHDPDRLPFVPGVHPCRWRRLDPRTPWPRWVLDALGLPADRPANAQSLAERGSLDPNTAEGRYRRRLARWTAGRSGPGLLAARLAHRGWWLLHNLVVHPLLGLVHGRRALALHDWTGRRLDADDRPRSSAPPRIDRRLWWLVHNLAAHPAIALAPCAATFRWHDATARRMRVPGWA